MGNKRCRINNSGMSLLELLVAIIILAIIVVPLLHTFVSASRVNLNARQKLKITTAAQDVMEGLKAESLEEVASEVYFPNGTAPDGTNVNKGFRVINNSLIDNIANIKEVRCVVDSNGGITNLAQATDALAASTGDDDDAPCIKYDSTEKKIDFVEKNNTGKYYFAIPGMNIENVTNATFKADVLVEMDASRYREGGSITNNDAKHNAIALASMGGLNNSIDCILAESTTQTDSAINKINSFNGSSYTSDDLYKDITVNITKPTASPGVSSNKIYVEFNVDYKICGTSISCPESLSQTYYYTDDNFRDIYLLYFPSYNNWNYSDKITINNDNGVQSNLYIVKKQCSNDSNLASLENGYKCDVKISEKDSSGSVTDVNSKILTIRTNLDYNLRDLYNSSSIASIMSTRQASFTYNSNPVTRENLKIEQLGGEAVEDRIYDLKVYLYEEGALSGTTVDSSKLLMKLDSSID